VPLLSSSPAAAAVAPQSTSDDVQFDRMSEEDLLRGLENLAPPTETDEEAE
jgi:DNA-directed RNA polymerase subunit omega